ncbi:MAG: TolC family protein [Candidatus Aminicenantes bacterium]|nr:TolC family protein [Candidatus Aminicenantes bacterium]
MNSPPKSHFPGLLARGILGLCALVIVFGAGALAVPAAQASLGQASGNEKNLELSLDECIVKTLKNNLGLAAEMLTPRMMDEAVTVAREKFYPTVSFSYNKQSTETASYSFLDASDVVSTRQNDNTTQLSQVLPGGGSLSVSLYNYLSDSNRRFQTINPRYGSTLRFSFSQPLLKDFGFRMSRREIIVAGFNRDVSEENLNQVLENTIYRVESGYWILVYSRENLNVVRQSLKLAEELLENNRIQVEAGMLPPIELLTAEAEVKLRQAEILEAEAQVKNNEELLKTIINLSAEMDDLKSVRITPTDTPTVDRADVDFDQALETAIRKRPDLQALRIGLKNREFDLSYAKNQLLPDVRLQLSYWSPGLSGDQILYQDGNALSGIVVGTVPGKQSTALKDAFRFTYANSSIGVTVSLPVSNVLSRAYHAQAKTSLERAKLLIKNQEQQLTLELGNAVRAVETNYLRTQAYKAARELAQQKLEAELEKLQVGMSTNYLVLQYQRDRANAQTLELKALIDYKISLAELDRVMGVGRERQNVNVVLESW